jgi:hypothetical protein
MGSVLNKRNKAFTFGSTQVGSKSLAMKYPKIIYIAVEPVGSLSSSQYVDLEVDYWFTNNHQFTPATSDSASSSSGSSDKEADMSNQETIIIFNGQQ